MNLRNNIIIAALGVILTLSSCSEDFLEKNPSTSLSSGTVVSSVADIKVALVGAYNFMTTSDLYPGDYLLIGDMMGDDLMNPAYASGHIGGYYDYSTTKISSSAYSQYVDFYLAINHINEILVKAEAIEATGEYNNYIAQLKALRALAYFDVVKLYGPIYVNLGKGDIAADALGVPILTEPVEDLFAPFYRSTVKDVYEFIETELDAVIASDIQTAPLQGYLNKTGVQLLAARLALYMGNMSKALTLAEAVIDNGDYSLISRDKYVASWASAGASSESIFEMIVSAEDNSSWNSIGYYVSPLGYAEAAATSDFLELKDADTQDVRFELFVDTGDATKPGFMPTAKYPGQGGDSRINNPKVLRLSEAYLIAAEAALESNSAKAAEYLNDIRSNRTLTEPTKYTAASISLDDILYERRVELVAEGHRAWDLIRNQRSIVRWADATEKLAKGHTDQSEGIIEFDWFKTIAPILEDEIVLFPAEDQATQQNPGY